MESPETLKPVGVPLWRSLWQRLRVLAAGRKTSMAQMCAEWIRLGVASAEAERGCGLSSADEVTPAA